MQQIKKLAQIMKSNSMEFCRNTSLHGLQYIGEKHRPIAERIFWFISFLVSTAVVTYFILKIWNKWNNYPVLVSFADVPTPVWDIPFPAITICPEVKIKRTVFKYSDVRYKKNKTAEETANIEYSELVCNNFFIQDFPGENTTDYRAIEFIERVAPNIDQVMFLCRWGGFNVDCGEIFTSVLTDEGLCYTFNILSSEELFKNGTIQKYEKHLNHNETLSWSPEKGYDDSEANDMFPRRALASGARSGLFMFLGMENKHVDAICSFSIDGVKVLLHNPTDYPNVHDQYFRVPFDRDCVVGIKPKMITTNEGLRSYEPERRRCYFASERHLRHFKIYTQQNCDFECFTNYTLAGCGCVAFFMPRDKDTPICGAGKKYCLLSVSDDFAMDDDGLFKCNCMPACTEITYDVETSQANFRWFETVNEIQRISGNNISAKATERMASVSFYYKDRQFVTNRRGELFGPADFLASCGGLLGLYLGFSLLSLVEIVYFFTVRLFCNFRAKRKSDQ